MKIFVDFYVYFALLLFSVSSINSFFHRINRNTFIPTADQYLLTSRQFQVKSIDSLNNASSDELPHSIQVHFSDNIGIKQIITLIQVQGLLSKAPYEHNNVYQVENKQIKQLKKHDLNFKIYNDQKNKVFATCVSNSDLISMGIKTNGAKFRILLSTFLNGNQIDYHPVLITGTDNNTTEYQQIYISRNASSSNDFQKSGNKNEYEPKLLLNKGNVVAKKGKNRFDSKRSVIVNGVPRVIGLFVEYLIVIDSSVYNIFASLYANLSSPVLAQYISIFFCQQVNAINQRYSNSLKNDPDLMITVSLSNILIYTNPAATPWASEIAGVPGIPSYGGRSTILANASLALFSNYMNNLTLPFKFDAAVAIMNKDIWSNLTTASSSSRSAAIGYSIIGGICSSKKYSIIEYSAFSIVQNAGHELGHSLGAVHDQTGVAAKCLASSNYMMTTFAGLYSTNLQNLNYFSNCSINSFKATLLTSNMANLTTAGQCLSNTPISPLTTYYNSTILPGQLYTVDQQCQFLYGLSSNYYTCSAPKDPICSMLYCYVPSTGQCIGVQGYGAMDGTPCYKWGIKNAFCYNSACVNATSTLSANLSDSPCSSTNPCKNGGTCVTSYTKNFFVCNCASGYTGYTCNSIIGVS